MGDKSAYGWMQDIAALPFMPMDISAPSARIGYYRLVSNSGWHLRIIYRVLNDENACVCGEQREALHVRFSAAATIDAKQSITDTIRREELFMPHSCLLAALRWTPITLYFQRHILLLPIPRRLRETGFQSRNTYKYFDATALSSISHITIKCTRRNFMFHLIEAARFATHEAPFHLHLYL